jgi:hypothetical protein
MHYRLFHGRWKPGNFLFNLKAYLMTEKIEMVVPEEVLISKIFHIRDYNVMLDEDLANLYGVETKQLKDRSDEMLIASPKTLCLN